MTMIMPEYIDIHSHISFPDFDADREAVIGRMKEKNIWAIDVGTDFKNSKKAAKDAAANDGIFSSAGLHPTDDGNEDFDAAVYKKLFANPKVVAVGECGLDYFRLDENNQASQKSKVESKKQRQKKIFEMQIELALELDKSLMIHCRDAHDEQISILKEYVSVGKLGRRGVIHCFTGTWEEAQK